MTAILKEHEQLGGHSWLPGGAQGGIEDAADGGDTVGDVLRQELVHQ